MQAKMQREAEPQINLQLKGEIFGWQKHCKLSRKNERRKRVRKESRMTLLSFHERCFAELFWLTLIQYDKF
jgi:hypothetical protein